MTPSLPPILRALSHVRKARASADRLFKTDLHDHLREAEAALEEVAKEAWKETDTASNTKTIERE